MFIGVDFSDGTAVNCRSTEVTFDCGRHDTGECDVWVFDGEGLIEDEGGGFGGRVQGPCRGWDDGGEGVDEDDGRRL